MTHGRRFSDKALTCLKQAALLAIIIGMMLIVMAARARAEGNQFGVGSSEFRVQGIDIDRSIRGQAYIPITGLARRDEVVALAAFALVDYKQSTDAFFKRGHHDEVNPLLGKQPSRGELLTFGLIGTGLTYLVEEILPESWSRLAVRSIVKSEQMNIEWNRIVAEGYKRPARIVPIVISWEF